MTFALASAPHVAHATPPLTPRPFNDAPPVIGGVLVDRAQLTAHPGTWTSDDPPRFDYQWFRCNADDFDSCTSPLGAGAHYALTTADVGKWLRISVEATSAGGSASAESEIVGPVLSHGLTTTLGLTERSEPVISGQEREGSVLEASEGLWYGPPDTFFWYQWRRCAEGCEDIAGAVTPYYVPTRYDVGQRLVVRVSAVVPTVVPAPSTLLPTLLDTLSQPTSKVKDSCPTPSPTATSAGR